MPSLSSVDEIATALVFFAPGLIALFVRAQFLTGRRPSHSDAILSYLTLSIIYYALTFPIVDAFRAVEGYDKTFVWIVVVIVGPIVFGLVLGLNAQFEYGRRFLQRMGLNPVHVMPTAWDWKFAGITQEWILVVLQDGTEFAGYFGEKSFASSDTDERDLYIELVYDIGENDVWTQRRNGVLIPGREIRTIEFWPNNEDD
jgi:hypothetical protein